MMKTMMTMMMKMMKMKTNNEKNKKNETTDEKDKKNETNNEEGNKKNKTDDGKKKEDDKDNDNKEKTVQKKLRCEALLLGFEKYKFDEENNKASFNVYFVPVYRKLLAEKLKITLKIEYESSLRNTNENNVEVECKKKSYKNRNVKFYCEFTPKKKEIENIEVDEDFDFIDQEVNIKGCSPIARKHMKNLLDAGKNDIFKQKLYILESAEKSINKNSINIIGKINDKLFNSDKVTLTIVTSDNNDEKKNRMSL